MTVASGGSIPNCTYDEVADSAHIPLRSIGSGDVKANIMVDDERLEGYVIIDLNGRGKVVGIELIGVGSMLDTTIPWLSGRSPEAASGGSIPNCTYDEVADSAHIPLRSIGNGDVEANIMVENERLEGYVVIDLNGRGKVVGIELIGVGSMLDTTIPWLNGGHAESG